MPRIAMPQYRGGTRPESSVIAHANAGVQVSCPRNVAALATPSFPEQVTDLLPVRILVISDVRLYLDGLLHCLRGVTGIEVTGTASAPVEALSRAAALRPQVIVLDTAMANGPGLARELAAQLPDAHIIAFAVTHDERHVLAFAEAGVAGYVPRDASAADLVAAIQGSMRGELSCPPDTAAIVFRRFATLAASAAAADGEISRLTPRERTVVELIDEGLSNKQIARRLYIEVATVKNHVHNILEKLGVSRRGEAAARLRRGAPLPGRGEGGGRAG
jgi:two-component system, NarL family, nitrate/nitrite response regulator NarL